MVAFTVVVKKVWKVLKEQKSDGLLTISAVVKKVEADLSDQMYVIPLTICSFSSQISKITHAQEQCCF